MRPNWHAVSGLALLTRNALALAAAAPLLLLIGCGGEPGANLAPSSTPVPAPPPIPEVSQLRITLPLDNFASLDFMALLGCELRFTLGKYQSSLGRYASDSQRLLLDLEYLRVAPLCIELKRAAAENALADTLQHFQTLKRRQLASRIYNATLAAPEFQQFWRGAAYKSTQTGQAALTQSALANINSSVKRWLSNDYRASNIEFEIQLSEVAKGGATGTVSIDLQRTVHEVEGLLTIALPPAYQLWLTSREGYSSRLAPPTKLN